MDDDFMQGFCRCPAGVKIHHAYVGGLLEHVVTMMDVAERILPLYPEVDRDLLLMGVFLHDIGKVRELSYARTFAYTDEGQLLGHLVIGVEMLAEKARQVPDLTGEPFPPELLLRLKHLILSHHGEPEFGSPKVPMTPEAIALHAIDLLDSRIHIAVREIADDRGGVGLDAVQPGARPAAVQGRPQRRLRRPTDERRTDPCRDLCATLILQRHLEEIVPADVSRRRWPASSASPTPRTASSAAALQATCCKRGQGPARQERHRPSGRRPFRTAVGTFKRLAKRRRHRPRRTSDDGLAAAGVLRPRSPDARRRHRRRGG